MRIKKKSETYFDVIDMDMVEVFHATTLEDRDAFKKAIELVNHRVMVREVRS